MSASLRVLDTCSSGFFGLNLLEPFALFFSYTLPFFVQNEAGKANQKAMVAWKKAMEAPTFSGVFQ